MLNVGITSKACSSEEDMVVTAVCEKKFQMDSIAYKSAIVHSCILCCLFSILCTLMNNGASHAIQHFSEKRTAICGEILFFMKEEAG